MIQITLDSKSWFRNENLSVRGYCFDKSKQLFINEGLLDFFGNIENEETLDIKLKEANGIFSLIIHRQNFEVATVDRTRVYPLYYTVQKDTLHVSDNPYNLLTNRENTIDLRSLDEINHLGFVLGERTLIYGLFQVCPSSYIILKNGKYAQKYFSHFKLQVSETLEATQITDLTLNIFEESIQRLVKSANGRQLVLPLSGGFDSRVILCLLKKIGYKNVLCYNVGRPGNPEHVTSEKVAKQLEYPYYFINNSSEQLISDYTRDDFFKKYYVFSGNLSATFWMYEYFAIKYLIENHLIDVDSIFIPGHSGDFLAGSHFSKAGIKKYEKQKNIIKKIVHNKFNISDTRPLKKKTQVITTFISNEMDNSEYYGYSIFDDFEYKEHLPKYINNSTRIYEYFGHEVRLLFWDNQLLDLFRKMPYELKLYNTFYNDFVETYLFKPLGVDYKHEFQQRKIRLKWQRIKNILKKYVIPRCLAKKINREADYTCMKEISAPLRTELTENNITVFGSYNKVFLKWYLFKISSKFHSS